MHTQHGNSNNNVDNMAQMSSNGQRLFTAKLLLLLLLLLLHLLLPWLLDFTICVCVFDSMLSLLLFYMCLNLSLSLFLCHSFRCPSLAVTAGIPAVLRFRLPNILGKFQPPPTSTPTATADVCIRICIPGTTITCHTRAFRHWSDDICMIGW